MNTVYVSIDIAATRAAYANLVPHHRRSESNFNGRSYIVGGHGKLRRVLYGSVTFSFQDVT